MSSASCSRPTSPPVALRKVCRRCRAASSRGLTMGSALIDLRCWWARTEMIMLFAGIFAHAQPPTCIADLLTILLGQRVLDDVDALPVRKRLATRFVGNMSRQLLRFEVVDVTPAVHERMGDLHAGQ